ncbi:MAG: 2-keto-myo-inositol dehydratase [Acidobacteria bacterium]|nr:2-keto-myo-inositol dehydratase [Acidobacteriota bacterium]
MIRVANAPCSWGALEFEAAEPPAPAAQVLDEMAAAGYAGTELGDWGFLPTVAPELAAAVARRNLALIAAFVPIALARPEALDEGIARAVRTARLLADAAGADALIVLADDNASVPNRTARAGRIRAEDGLAPAEWDGYAQRAERIAAGVRAAAGLRTVFHHHCAGYVETPAEIDALLSRTDPALLGLCLDTGHLTFAGGDPLAMLAQYGDRIWHVHFKDCEPALALQSRAEGWDYHTAIRRGIFCELGRGTVPFDRVLDNLCARQYAGWIVVEQDVLPGLGTPAASATRNRAFLRRLGV